MAAAPPALFPGGGQRRVAERLFQVFEHLLGADLPEAALLHVPVLKQAAGGAGVGLLVMPGDPAVVARLAASA